MRLASFALSAAALAPLLGCSSPVPASPDTAWTVNMSSAGGMCDLMISTTSVGDVDDQNITTRISDAMAVTGAGAAKVTCTVKPAGSGFDVEGYSLSGYDSLQISIPNFSKSATQAMPSDGSVTFLSDKTVQPFAGTCHFFITGKEGVDSGKAWMTFTCDGLEANGNPPSVCPVNLSYVAFENCLTM